MLFDQKKLEKKTPEAKPTRPTWFNSWGSASVDESNPRYMSYVTKKNFMAPYLTPLGWLKRKFKVDLLNLLEKTTITKKMNF